MPTDITETAAKGTVLSVPVGTDKRKAASLMAAWQAIGNRLNYSELQHAVFGDADDDGLGAAFVLAADLAFAMGTNAFRISRLIVDELAVSTFTFSPLVVENTIGRVPKKVAPATLTANGSIDPRKYDLIFTEAGSSIELQIETQTYVKGDHFRVCNRASAGGSTVVVKAPGGGTVYTLGVALSVSRSSHVDMVFDGTDWVEAGNTA